MPVYADSQKQHFLEKLALKLGRPTPDKAPLRSVMGPPDFWTAAKSSPENLLKQFVDNAERLTAKVLVATDKSQIKSRVMEWLAEIKAKSVMCWDSSQLKEAGIPEACRAAGAVLTFWDYLQDRREMIRRCASVDVGITWANYGIANTGSLAVLSSPVQSRAVSLLPPVHIALLDRKNILPHMGDIFARLDQANLPSALNFITGPSRTSDIEMDLALGVHGPGKVFILISE